MKLASSQNDFSESTDMAESGVYRAKIAFPFGADRINAQAISSVRHGTVIRLQSVGFEPKNRVVPRGALRLVLIVGRGFYFL